MFPADVEVSAPVASALGIGVGRLHVRRAWPRDADRVPMELTDLRGWTVAGQWIRDAERLRRFARQTAKTARPGTVHVVGDGVLLQAAGADRQLVGLRVQLDRPGSRLLVHRPERRAVVALGPVTGAAGTADHPSRYTRVLRPGRTAPVVSAANTAHALTAPLGLRVPRVVAHDVDAGVVTVTAVPGAGLEHLLSPATAVPALAESSAAALLDGYRPDRADRARIGAYGAAIRLRLACQYAFRPLQRDLSGIMLDRITAPLPGTG